MEQVVQIIEMDHGFACDRMGASAGVLFPRHALKKEGVNLESVFLSGWGPFDLHFYTPYHTYCSYSVCFCSLFSYLLVVEEECQKAKKNQAGKARLAGKRAAHGI